MMSAQAKRSRKGKRVFATEQTDSSKGYVNIPQEYFCTSSFSVLEQKLSKDVEDYDENGNPRNHTAPTQKHLNTPPDLETRPYTTGSDSPPASKPLRPFTTRGKKIITKESRGIFYRPLSRSTLSRYAPLPAIRSKSKTEETNSFTATNRPAGLKDSVEAWCDIKESQAASACLLSNASENMSSPSFLEEPSTTKRRPEKRTLVRSLTFTILKTAEKEEIHKESHSTDSKDFNLNVTPDSDPTEQATMCLPEPEDLLFKNNLNPDETNNIYTLNLTSFQKNSYNVNDTSHETTTYLASDEDVSQQGLKTSFDTTSTSSNTTLSIKENQLLNCDKTSNTSETCEQKSEMHMIVTELSPKTSYNIQENDLSTESKLDVCVGIKPPEASVNTSVIVGMLESTSFNTEESSDVNINEKRNTCDRLTQNVENHLSPFELFKNETFCHKINIDEKIDTFSANMPSENYVENSENHSVTKELFSNMPFNIAGNEDSKSGDFNNHEQIKYTDILDYDANNLIATEVPLNILFRIKENDKFKTEEFKHCAEISSPETTRKLENELAVTETSPLTSFDIDHSQSSLKDEEFNISLDRDALEQNIDDDHLLLTELSSNDLSSSEKGFCESSKISNDVSKENVQAKPSSSKYFLAVHKGKEIEYSCHTVFPDNSNEFHNPIDKSLSPTPRETSLKASKSHVDPLTNKLGKFDEFYKMNIDDSDVIGDSLSWSDFKHVNTDDCVVSITWEQSNTDSFSDRLCT
ncbi:uncharacterized protein LOC143250881 [Tachypleus tridentatus]|uniref:uncharacterized protein LOC143250881 n=1 Tax=Tachypleus tridentatus TaxID=6853 RepID=UPI003FD39FD3